MKEIVIALVVGFIASKVLAFFTWKRRLRGREALFHSLVGRERSIADHRWECVEAVVGNTCDNVYGTGQSLNGVTIREAAAYHLVQASYDPEDFAEVLAETAARVSELMDSVDPDKDQWLAEACLWNEEIVKAEGVAILRQMATMEDDTAGRPYMVIPVTDVKAREG